MGSTSIVGFDIAELVDLADTCIYVLVSHPEAAYSELEDNLE